MLMNYHELTMNEARDSPARRKQYLVICTVMAVFCIHAMITSGVLMGVSLEEGILSFASGSTFVYKYTVRDYAASMAVLRGIAKDANLDSKHFQDNLYTLYLDDPTKMGGLRQRFAAGILSPDKSVQKSLLDRNKKRELTQEQQQDEAMDALIPKLQYQTTSFPNNVKAVIVNFPFTNGFMSALVLSYKIIPAMRSYVEQHGDKGTFPVVLSTCSVQQGMCTHYAPLSQGSKFLLNQPDSDTYLESLPKEKSLDWRKILKGSKKKFGRYFGFSSKKEDKEEL